MKASSAGEQLKSLTPRTKPSQKRSIARREQILEVAAGLLERLGPSALTTIRIAQEVGISVGTLYHYFPNKEAILHAMGEHWLEQMAKTLDEQSQLDLTDVDTFVAKFVSQMNKLYRLQKGLLHLVQGMFAIPQLMPLDEQHDELVIAYVSKSLPMLGIQLSLSERQRIGRSFHEVSHALLLVVAHQNQKRATTTLTELNLLLATLLKFYTN
jgi:AcrR family transcriptional regulator